jgi:hypothetical protein
MVSSNGSLDGAGDDSDPGDSAQGQGVVSGSAEEPQRGPEAAPTLVFELDWASPTERLEIMDRARAYGRQTMNLRLMPEARLLRLRAVQDGNRIVGWAGFDIAFTPGMGEVFSLFVEPEYRTYLVGLVLETARCAYLKKAGASRVLCRMAASTNDSLLSYRLGNGLMMEADAREISPGALALCRQCELFGASCARQAYVWVNVDRFLERGTHRLGTEIDTGALPTTISLDPARFRKSRRPPHPDGPRLRGHQASDDGASNA